MANGRRSWRRGPRRHCRRAHAYLLHGRSNEPPRLGLWLRPVPGLRAAGARLCGLYRRRSLVRICRRGFSAAQPCASAARSARQSRYRGRPPEKYRRRSGSAPRATRARQFIAARGVPMDRLATDDDRQPPPRSGRADRHAALPRVHMLRQAEEMQIGTIVENRPTRGNTDRAAEIAHQVEEPGSELQPVGREAAESEGDDRRDGELLREAAEACGSSNSCQPHSCVIGANFQILPAASRTSPANISQRRSIRRAKHGIDRNGGDLENSGGEHRSPISERAEPAHARRERPASDRSSRRCRHR